MDNEPLQQRIVWDEAPGAAVISLQLNGLMVVIDIWEGEREEIYRALRLQDIAVSVVDGVGLAFPIHELSKMGHMPEEVEVRPRGPLRALYKLATSPPTNSLPALVTKGTTGDLRIKWISEDGAIDESLTQAAGKALLASKLPFKLAPDAWGEMEVAQGMPMELGLASLGPDGFVEIVTPKPQLLEAAPIPGLFKLDATHYGVPAVYFKSLREVAGIKWSGPEPAPMRSESNLPSGALALSGHHIDDLGRVVGRLKCTGTVVLAWEHGLGRRIMALAACEALSSFPLVVVTTSEGLWSWHRHLQLIPGREVEVTTYEQLAVLGIHTISPECIIFDEINAVPYMDASVRRALMSLDGYADMYRVGISSVWPSDLAAAYQALAVARPTEFRVDQPLSVRYPVPTEQRAQEHFAAYLESRHSSDADVDPRQFRRSRVVAVPISKEQEEALQEDPTSEVLVSSGTRYNASPKIGAAVSIARDAIRKRRRVVVVTRHERTAKMLEVGLLPLEVGHQTSSECPAVVLLTESVPELSMFDEVVLLDYYPFAEVDKAIGSPLERSGPKIITQLHSPLTLDDSLAQHKGVSGSKPSGFNVTPTGFVFRGF